MIPRRRDDRGAVAVVAAVSLGLLMLVAALVVDLGMARDVRRQSQNASDAAALAAGSALYPAGYCATPAGASPPCFSDAVAAARSYAASNFGVTASHWAACSDARRPSGYYVPVGGTPCISFDSATAPTKVRVNLPTRSVSTGFGALAGVAAIPISTAARASVSGGAPRSCGLCFLADVDAGNADFTVVPGGIMVNGSVTTGAQSHWTSGTFIGTSGTITGGTFSPAPTAIAPFGDPLAGLGMPVTTGLAVRSYPCGANGGPGIYGAVNLLNGPCPLQSGLYVVVGGWTAKNNTVLTGTGVTLYMLCGTTSAPRACAAGEAGGFLDAKNGLVRIDAPSAGALQGLGIVYDRNNTSDLGLQGNGSTSVTGTVYLRSGALDFNGSSCFVVSRGPVVARDVITASGDKACLTILDSSDAAVPQPPSEVALDQ